MTSPNPTADRAVEIAKARYRASRGHQPVLEAETFWDTSYRLHVALWGDADTLLAVYRFIWARDDVGERLGVHRVAKRIPQRTHPFTLDNVHMLAMINAADAADAAGDAAAS